VFGYSEYKGKQKEIFEAAINGMGQCCFERKNTKRYQFFLSVGADVLVVAPTGMGKVRPFPSTFPART
jgi:hypothetical protein